MTFSNQLLTQAEKLASGNRPSGADLRRAVSSTYYALFHAICALCADELLGKRPTTRRAWVQVYRAVDHGNAENACKMCKQYGFPADIVTFSRAFEALKKKREDADYNPFPEKKLTKADVAEDIGSAKEALKALTNVEKPHKKAFAAFILFKKR